MSTGYYFGKPWDTDACEGDAVRIPLPFAPCVYCKEHFQADDRGIIMGDGRPIHRECLWRMSRGSAAHIAGLCIRNGGCGSCDDSHLTRRQTAIAAWNMLYLVAGIVEE